MPNPTGNYSRVKTWQATDVLLASDLNTEFDNVLNNFNPEMLAAYSQNQAQMQIQTNPGGVGSESLATALSGELERLRFQLASIQGTTYWYQTPASTIAQLNSALGSATLSNKISSGLTSGTTGSVQPIFLLAANTTNTVTLKASVTPFVYTIAGTTYTISSDVSISGLTKAPSSSNTTTINDLTLAAAGTQSNNILGENGSVLTVATMAAGINTQVGGAVGNIAAFKLNSEYIIGRIESATQISQVFRGYFFNSSNALVSRGTVSNGDTLTLMKLTWVFASTVGTISPVYTNPRVSGVAPTSPATGDYWFDTSANIWKTYNSTTWVAANATLIGLCIQDSSNTVATRSFDFFAAFADTNTLELFADPLSDGSGTRVRAKFAGAQVSVYGTLINYLADYARWDFSTDLDTGSQTASTLYYFYIDTNGRSWISKVAPLDRRADLRGHYHPGLPWRCVGYGWSNSATQLENVESFFITDLETAAVSNITAAASNIILPYNIVQRERVITLTGAAGAFTQSLPPAAQLKGKYVTFVRTDNNPGNLITLQSWGTIVANTVGTLSLTLNPTVITAMTGTSGIAAGQLIQGPGIPANTTCTSVSGTVATMSANAALTLAGGTFVFANAAGYAGTVGQQTAYSNWGINGYFTLYLAVQGESYTITSDGYAYYIKDHYVPGTWFNAGAMTLSSTSGTAPVKGTTGLDQVRWRRQGQFAHIIYRYNQTGAGSVGTGDYVLGLPAGLTADTNQVPIYTTVTPLNITNASYPSLLPGSGIVQETGSSYQQSLFAYLFSSTSFRLCGAQSFTTGGVNWSATTNQHFGQTTLSLGLDIWVPILNWYG